MTNKHDDWATVVNTGASCGIPRVKRIDSTGTIWIGLGGFSIAFPSRVWDRLVQEVEKETIKGEK